MKTLYKVQLLIVLFAITLFADVFEIKSFKEDIKDLSARVESKKDVNDEYCAIIKIRTSIEGIKFYSNQLVDMIYKTGEYWVYVSPGIRNLEIIRGGFAKFAYNIPIKIKSQNVYIMELTNRDRNIPINVITQPKGAKVYIDDQLLGTGTSYKINMGKHTLKLVKEGYRTVQKNITVSENSHLFTNTLEELKQAQLLINSNPKGAVININKAYKGKTNLGMWLFPGKYNLELSLPGYSTITSEIVVEENKTNKFDFKLQVADDLCRLKLKVIPDDAKVLINKVNYSKQNSIKLSQGLHKIEISKNGYKTFSEVLSIGTEKKLEKEYRLIQLTGSLRFSVQPTNTSVEMLKDKKIWNSWMGMKYWESVPVGNYSIICKTRGYDDKTQNVKIDVDKTLNLNLVMVESSSGSIFSWIKNHKIATGLIVTALSAGGYYYYKSQSSGDNYNGQLPGIDGIWPPK